MATLNAMSLWDLQELKDMDDRSGVCKSRRPRQLALLSSAIILINNGKFKWYRPVELLSILRGARAASNVISMRFEKGPYAQPLLVDLQLKSKEACGQLLSTIRSMDGLNLVLRADTSDMSDMAYQTASGSTRGYREAVQRASQQEAMWAAPEESGGEVWLCGCGTESPVGGPCMNDDCVYREGHRLTQEEAEYLGFGQTRSKNGSTIEVLSPSASTTPSASPNRSPAWQHQQGHGQHEPEGLVLPQSPLTASSNAFDERPNAFDDQPHGSSGRPNAFNDRPNAFDDRPNAFDDQPNAFDDSPSDPFGSPARVRTAAAPSNAFDDFDMFAAPPANALGHTSPDPFEAVSDSFASDPSDPFATRRAVATDSHAAMPDLFAAPPEHTIATPSAVHSMDPFAPSNDSHAGASRCSSSSLLMPLSQPTPAVDNSLGSLEDLLGESLTPPAHAAPALMVPSSVAGMQKKEAAGLQMGPSPGLQSGMGTKLGIRLGATIGEPRGLPPGQMVLPELQMGIGNQLGAPPEVPMTGLPGQMGMGMPATAQMDDRSLSVMQMGIALGMLGGGPLAMPAEGMYISAPTGAQVPSQVGTTMAGFELVDQDMRSYGPQLTSGQASMQAATAAKTSIMLPTRDSQPEVDSDHSKLSGLSADMADLDRLIDARAQK